MLVYTDCTNALVIETMPFSKTNNDLIPPLLAYILLSSSAVAIDIKKFSKKKKAK